MGSDKHSFHVKPTSGPEVDIPGDDAIVEGGALVIKNHSGDMVRAYGPAAWEYCEPEKRDDTTN